MNVARMNMTRIGALFDSWLFFTLSDKAKFAIKVALAMSITYLFILYNGLENATVAILTIMLIATPEGVKGALSKGLLRLGGTIIGAIIGLSLIALFPQQPFLYLLSLSIAVSILLYLRNAYSGDETLFMLSAMTAMSVFDGGNVDDVFMYGVDRTLLTIIAIVVYTLLFVLIWPNHTLNSEESAVEKPMFVWLDPEHLKGVVQTFCVFWAASAFWYFFNPPGGFMIVMFATGFSALTSFSPIKPSIMALLVNVSLFIAIILYIFVLPNLTHWIELSVVLFLYTFFAFYFFPPMLSIIVLLGLNTLMITNTMSYNVDIFLGIVLVLDIVFAFLMLLYYFPFSTKPEHLYLQMIKRFNRLNILALSPSPILQWYAQSHLDRTLEKLQLWGNKLDFAYFTHIQSEKITELHQSATALHNILASQTRRTSDETQKLQTLITYYENLIEGKSLGYAPLYSTTLQPYLDNYHCALRAIDWADLKKGRF